MTSKLGLMVGSCFVALLICEMMLRMMGFVYLTQQHRQNKQKIEQADTLRILCIGESTTALGGEDAYPAQLEVILNERFSGQKQFTVINNGVPGINTASIMTELPGWIDEYNPHMVVSMMGVNDGATLIPFVKKTDLNPIGEFLKNLRLVKLSQWIYASLKNRKEEKTKKKGLTDYAQANKASHAIEINQKSEEYQKMYFMYMVLEGQKEYDKAEFVLRKVIQLEEDAAEKRKLNQKLFRMLEEQEKYLHMVNMLDKVPHYSWGDRWLNAVCQVPAFVPAVEAALQPQIDKRKDFAPYYDVLSACYAKANMTEKAEALQASARSVRQKAYKKMNYESYEALIEILEQVRIPGIFVQYPMRNVDDLRRMIEDIAPNQEFYYVDNQKSFQESVAQKGYNALFTDRFAGDFGHCTKAGNQLLATNVSQVIADITRDGP